MRTEIISITPRIAEELMKKNTGNYRTLDHHRVKRYSMDMSAGRWDENGESIKLNGTILIDGQHRLAAIIRSGVTIRCVVVHGVNSAANIDTGKARRVSDWLRHEGVKNATHIGAAARLALLHDRKLWATEGHLSDQVTNQEIIDYAVMNNDSLQDAHNLAARAKNLVIGCQLATVIHIGSKRGMASNNRTCVWFVDALAKGENLSGNEPVFHLRNKLFSITPTRSISTYAQRMMLTFCWNKTVLGESMNLLRLNFTGPAKNEPPSEVLEAEENQDSDEPKEF